MNGKETEGKPRLDLIPYEMMTSAARGLEHGVEKYGLNNYRLGMPWTVYGAAALRHVCKWLLLKEDIDEDSGLHHLDLALGNLAILVHYRDNNVGEDDRLAVEARAEGVIHEPISMVYHDSVKAE